MRGKERTAPDPWRSTRQPCGNLVRAAPRRDLDAPVEDPAIASRQVAGHAGFVGRAMPLRDDDVANLSSDHAVACDAEQCLGRRVELDDDALIVAGDNRVEGAFE